MDVFRQIFDWLGGALNDMLGWVLGVLPDSPFKLISKSPIGEYLPYINYFIDVRIYFRYSFSLGYLHRHLLRLFDYTSLYKSS